MILSENLYNEVMVASCDPTLIFSSLTDFLSVIWLHLILGRNNQASSLTQC